DEMSIPSSESADGFEILEQRFGRDAGGIQSGSIVFTADQGVNDPAVKAVMEPYLADVARSDGVTSVISPYDPMGARQVSQIGDRAGKLAYATVNVSPDLDQIEAAELGKQLREQAPTLPGGQVELGGSVFAE